MTVDQNISWSQLSPFANRFAIGQTVDECWHAGCVRDVLVPPDNKIGEAGEVLVAADTGGVWLTRSDGTGYVLSDFDKPDMWCLASFKGEGVSCVYAGGTGLYVSETPKFSLFPWREIALFFFSSKGLPGPMGPPVHRIAVMNEAQVIIIACVNGVFWSPIPSNPETGVYQWRQAEGLPSQNIRGFFGLTLGKILDSAGHRHVIVSSWGTALEPTDIFEGAFNAARQLHFNRSAGIGLIQLKCGQRRWPPPKPIRQSRRRCMQ